MSKIIHQTDFLTVTKYQKTAQHSNGDFQVDVYEVDFLGYKVKHHGYSRESIQKIIDKRTKAYELVPKGATIIPRPLFFLCEGLLIGGILEDSLYAVYGLGESGRYGGGIRGYSCSVYWLATDEEIKRFTDYESLHGDFIIKDK